MPDRDEIDADPPVPAAPGGGPALRSWPPGWTVRHVAEVGSTNAELLALGAAGAPGRQALVADHQLAGRGRLDRRWDAPPGANLLASVLLRDADPGGPAGPGGPGGVVQRLSLAALDACERVAGVRAELKWPNDILLRGAKLAGVLAEAGAGFVVVGIGLNVGWAPQGAAWLAAGGGPPVDPLDVLAETLRAFDALPADLTLRYRARLATLGQRVRVELPGGRSFEGVATDVDASGRLVVDAAGQVHVVDAGDVVHLRGA